MRETMQTFAILMASMGVVVALVYHLSSWSVFWIVYTLVMLLFVAIAFLWCNRRQFNWKRESDSERNV
jgi:membrane protein implicated in regulation of membrane protease activity